MVPETPAMAVLDANGVVGAYAAKFAMEFACERAKRVGAFTLTARNSPDWMMIGYSTRQALNYDCMLRRAVRLSVLISACCSAAA